MASPADVAVGIDVAKQRLAVAVHPTEATWTVPRTRGGLRRLRADLRALQPIRIVLEATGGYERRVVAALAGLPVVVVNPRQTHHFARALGLLAKADRLDAQMLARFAAEVRPPLRPAPAGCSASPASAPSPRPPCWPRCPNSAPAPARRSPPWSASRPAPATAAPGAARAASGVDAARSGRCCTWPRSPRSAPPPACGPATSGCTPPASRPRWP